MSKTKIKIPKYTLGEEITNAISHGLGVGLAIAILVLCIVKSAFSGSAISIISSCIYGTSMIIMYTISCLYHSFSPNIGAKKVFRILDHCDIYLFIAGSYTPYCLVALKGTMGIVLCSIIWACSLVGILLNCMNMEKFKKLSFALYLIIGWIAIFMIKPLVQNLAMPAIIYLVLGGLMYSLGAILYVVGKKKKYYHSIFHFFILIASILQFVSIFFYVI